MKIRSVRAIALHGPIPEHQQHTTDFGRIDAFDSTLVRVETEDGLVGFGEAKAGAGCFVGGSDLGPQPRRFGQGLFCARRIAVGEPHPSVGGAGDQCLAPESGGDDIELVGGRSGPGDVAICDRDLDLRLEQRGALQVGVR